jgi:uncharacterized protein Yka (UPF0111/DUF47 family)
MQDTNTRSKESKVYQLCQELNEMREQKKASARSFREEIKRIEDEIDDLLEPKVDPVELP